MRTWHVDISVTSYLLEGGSASIKGMSPGSAALSPQTTARLASLVDFFFRARQPFSPFSRNAEPGPRLVPGSKIVGKAGQGKLRENCLGAGQRQGSGACKHCFQYLITVYQLLVYPVIGQFRQLTSTLTLITWVHVCRVRPTWWVWKKKKRKKREKKHGECAKTAPTPDAVSLFTIKNLWHFDMRDSFSGSQRGSGWTEVVKKTLIDFHHLPSLVVFAL